jgi:hypothetical protein
VGGVPGEVHRCRASRVRAADDEDAFALDHALLARSGSVEDPRPTSASSGSMPTRRYETPVAMIADAARSSEPSSSGRTRSSPSWRSAVTSRPKMNFAPNVSACWKPSRRQLGSGDPGRKAEVVPHHRARARLPADAGRFDDRHAQALRRAIHGRGETCRAGTNDRDVDAPATDRTLEPEGNRDVGRLWLNERPSFGQDHDRQRTIDACLLQLCLTLRRPGVAEGERKQENG